MNSETDIIAAHTHSAGHREEIERSDQCGCFFCLEIFSPKAIDDWIQENPDNKPDAKLTGETAICPNCSVDAVIGSASGYPITRDFLEQMHQHWFGGV
ncbi:MAG: cytoplasmic protein [Pseudohongiellaceae bacterium]